MTVLSKTLSGFALIGLLAVPTISSADGSDAYQACVDMKWKAGPKKKKNCFRDLALVFEELLFAAGGAGAAVPGLEEKIAELVGMLEESGERYADLEAKYEESEDEIAELEEAAGEFEADLVENLATLLIENENRLFVHMAAVSFDDNASSCENNGPKDKDDGFAVCKAPSGSLGATMFQHGYQRALHKAQHAIYFLERDGRSDHLRGKSNDLHDDLEYMTNNGMWKQ